MLQNHTYTPHKMSGLHGVSLDWTWTKYYVIRHYFKTTITILTSLRMTSYYNFKTGKYLTFTKFLRTFCYCLQASQCEWSSFLSKIIFMAILFIIFRSKGSAVGMHHNSWLYCIFLSCTKSFPILSTCYSLIIASFKVTKSELLTM